MKDDTVKEINKVTTQLGNLSKIESIILDRIDNDVPRESLSNWISDTPCGSKGCILGDYVLQNKLTRRLNRRFEVTWPRGHVTIGNHTAFIAYCTNMNIEDEFGFPNSYSSPQNHIVFTGDYSSYYAQRLEVVRDTQKHLYKKLSDLSMPIISGKIDEALDE